MCIRDRLHNSVRCYYQTNTTYNSYEQANTELMTDDIPTVNLAFDRLKAPNKMGLNANPLVILHGFFGNKSNNRTLGKGLNEKLNRDVYLLDLRNHGRSPHIERHDYASMAHDVEKFIQTKINKEKKPIIIGHSMGAKVGMSVVLRKPDLCSMLVNMENAPVSKVPEGIFPRYIKACLLYTSRCV